MKGKEITIQDELLMDDALKQEKNKFPNDVVGINSIIDESFDGEEGILEIFKGVYKHAKGGSVPHATFIMNWYFKDGEGEEGIKEFRILEEIVE